jgi:hypothetical protein
MRRFDVMMLLMPLLVGGIVVAICTYDIYVHQALLGPKEVGTAKVEITGTGHFQGDFGTERNTYFVEGDAPAKVGIPFARSDFIMTGLQELPGEVKIEVGNKIVDAGSAGLGGGASAVWRVPRDFKAD